MQDKRVEELLQQEKTRQDNNIELIASENFVSKEIRELTGSILTNKYAEGYPNKRYYGGCENVDEIETLAIERAKELFHAEHANVQPHAGSQANMAVYFSVLNPGDKIMGMDLAAGGHLTHGSPVSFSGKLYEVHSYGVDPETEMMNYDEIGKIADEVKPKMIVCGASAYPRTIDFKAFREIADRVGAYLMVDMAHIAGLVATGRHPSPVPYADFVTSTTHKTLRGPRSGLILCKEEYAKQLDKTIFPGMQGGPLCHVTAAKAACFYEAMQPEFGEYCDQVLNNVQVLVRELSEEGFRIVSGGSDNHLLLLDTMSIGVTGKEAEAALDEVHITVNKNSIPFDTQKPSVTSGIRIGSAAMTTKGYGEAEFEKIAHWIAEVIRHHDDESVKEKVKAEVLTLTEQFPFD